MSEALKPCPNPWCESKESPLVFKDIFANGNPPYRGGCKLCRLYGPKAKTVAEARRLWNHRPVEDSLVEALKALCDSLRLREGSQLISINHDQLMELIPKGRAALELASK